jgi:hypothetical protein
MIVRFIVVLGSASSGGFFLNNRKNNHKKNVATVPINATITPVTIGFHISGSRKKFVIFSKLLIYITTNYSLKLGGSKDPSTLLRAGKYRV